MKTYDDIRKWAEELPAGHELDAMVAVASHVRLEKGESWSPSLRWDDAMLAATATRLFDVQQGSGKHEDVRESLEILHRPSSGWLRHNGVEDIRERQSANRGHACFRWANYIRDVR